MKKVTCSKKIKKKFDSAATYRVFLFRVLFLCQGRKAQLYYTIRYERVNLCMFLLDEN